MIKFEIIKGKLLFIYKKYQDNGTIKIRKIQHAHEEETPCHARLQREGLGIISDATESIRRYYERFLRSGL